MTTKRKVVLIILSLIIISASIVGGAFAYSKFFVQPKSESQQSAGTNNKNNSKPFTCPEGTKSPSGGRINWDGSTNCIPDDDKTSTSDKQSPNQPTTSNTQTPPAQETPAQDNKWCEDMKNKKAALLQSMYENKVWQENNQHENHLEAIKQDYTNRGLLRSSAYEMAVAQENAAHEQRLKEIDNWFAWQLLENERSC